MEKVNILNSSDTEKKNIQCSVCKTITNSNLYVCESGHVICKSCRNADTTIEDCNESGDYVPEKEFALNDDKKKLKNTISDTTTQDLASGDHDGARIPTNGKNSEAKADVTKEEHCSNSNVETTIEYKNSNYQESASNDTVSNNDSSKNAKGKKQDTQDCKIVPRPVVCPVTNCSKMVTIDSIMLHFHFDHSKVPRMILDETVPQEVSLKSTIFSTEVQCLATFVIETHKSTCKVVNKSMESIASIRNSFKNKKILLLMAVRYPTSPLKFPNLKSDKTRVFTRTIHTQTEKFHGNNLGMSTECLSKSSTDSKSCISKVLYDEDDVLLLWLCKLDNEEKVYSITLLGEDKKRGYCYIGNAVHVRDKQNPSSLYDRSECLTVKGSAVSGLYDSENQITAIVSMIG